MILSIASGKGGTGKTTVATSLALAISAYSPVFLDCDVEAPNAHLFLNPQLDWQLEVTLPVPHVDQGLCNYCGRCAEVCQFHAIIVVGTNTLVFPDLCHGCGSCTANCPEDAICEIPRPIGVLEAGVGRAEIRFARGTLNIGEPMGVPIIRDLKRRLPFTDTEVVIRDVSPGTSCSVVEAIRDADFVILVTEPTPFGLHDLKLAIELTHELDLPVGVIVNRDGFGDKGVDDFCREIGLSILMRIPLNQRIAKAIARAQPLVTAFPEYLPQFQHLYSQIQTSMMDGGMKINSPHR